MKYVYEFTNGRKLTKSEFLKWFEKKFLNNIRKFNMVNKNETISYKEKKDFRSVVLKEMLKLLSTKFPIKVAKFPKSSKKIAIPETSDTETQKIIFYLFKKDLNEKNEKPVENKKIKPLYSFLDKEVLLYAKLKNLNFEKKDHKQNSIETFIEKLKKNHPELSHSVIKTYLEHY